MTKTETPDQILDRISQANPDLTCTQILALAEPELTAYADAQAAKNIARQEARAQREADRVAAIRAAHPDALARVRARRAARFNQ